MTSEDDNFSFLGADRESALIQRNPNNNPAHRRCLWDQCLDDSAVNRSNDSQPARHERLAKYATINSRHLVTSTADAFLWYLSNIIQAAMKARPELLKSGENIRLDEILDFRRRSDLVEYLIDRKVADLSYGGMKKMEQYFADRPGINLFADQETRDTVTLFMEVRNIHVHNRGFVNSIFLSRVKNLQGLTPVLNERLHIDFDQYATFQAASIRSAAAIDAAVAQKFGLKRKRLSTWKAAHS